MLGYVEGFVKHLVDLLETTGLVARDTVLHALEFLHAVSGHDVSKIIAALESEKVDVIAVIAAVKAEFGIA